MTIALGINNIITFVTVLSPIIIGSFFILSSVLILIFLDLFGLWGLFYYKVLLIL